MIRGKKLYENSEFDTAVELVVWINSQTALHKDNWVLDEIDTTYSKGTKKPYWCGLVFVGA